MVTSIIKRVLYCCLAIAVLSLALLLLYEWRKPSSLTIAYVLENNRIEIKKGWRSYMDVEKFLKITDLSNLQSVDLHGFEHGDIGQVRHIYDLLSAQGYNSKLTIIYSGLGMPAWVYPVEDHRHDLLYDPAPILGILVEHGKLRLGTGENQLTKGTQTNEATRIVYGGVRDRVFRDASYDDLDVFFRALDLQNLPKNTFVEIICAESEPSMSIFRILKRLSLLGFQNFYLVFY